MQSSTADAECQAVSWRFVVIRVFRITITTVSLYLITHLFVFAVLPFAILISCLDNGRIPAIKRWFVKCLFAIVGKRLKVSGYSNFKPDRQYVIVSNYPSGYAGFALIGTFPHASLVAHAFLKRIPLLGQALSRIGTVFVQPGASGRGRRAIELYLERSKVIPSVIILPEGWRTPDGMIHRFMRGFVYIQRQTSFDVLPVTLNGLYRLKPMRRFYADPDAKPEMIIHPAVSSSTACKMSDEELLITVKSIINSSYQP